MDDLFEKTVKHSTWAPVEVVGKLLRGGPYVYLPFFWRLLVDSTGAQGMTQLFRYSHAINSIQVYEQPVFKSIQITNYISSHPKSQEIGRQAHIP